MESTLTIDQIKALIQKKHEQFIVARTKNEENINRFLTRVKTLYEEEPELFRGIDMPVGYTAREVVPAMFAEPFVEETYKLQRAELMKFYETVNKLAEEINRKAVAECLSQ